MPRIVHDSVEEVAVRQRRSIDISGQSHGTNPIPAACIKNGFLASGAIYGLAGGAPAPLDLHGQIEAMFANMAAILAAAGGSLDDIVHVSIKLADPGDRSALNRHWLNAFPDPASRPARHVDGEPLKMSPRLIAAEILAVLDPA